MAEKNVDILLVENNPNDVELILDALREQKPVNRIQVLGDGAEALDFIFCTGAYADRPDRNPRLILLALNLPKVTGLEVLACIRANPNTAAIPVVVLTSSRNERDIVESYRLHVNSYIVKPADAEQFTASVRQIGAYWLLNQPPEQAHLPL